MVSIIVPVFNTPASYLNLCLKSILEQSYTEFEILLIDDGSNQECATLLDEWESKDSRIILHHIQNEGVSHARNFALNIAQGKYVLFVDSDDIVAPDWLKWAVSIADNEGADAVYGQIKGISDSELTSIKNIRLSEKYVVLNKDEIWRLQCGLLVSGRKDSNPIYEFSHFGNWGKLIKKESIACERYAEDMYYGEDQLFNHQIIKHLNKVICSADISYYLLIGRRGSATNKFDENRAKMVQLFLNRIKETLPNNNEVKNSFYLHTLTRVDNPALLECKVNGKKSENVFEIRSEIKLMMKAPIFSEAIKNANLKEIKKNRKWLRKWLVKHKCAFLLAVWDKYFYKFQL